MVNILTPSGEPSGENGRLLFAAFVSVVGGTNMASDRRHLAP
jgi:hypothetical protein